MTFHPRRLRGRGATKWHKRELNSACRMERRGWRVQRMDERRGGIEHLSGLGHIWLKYMSPLWGVIFIRQPDKPELHRQRFFVIQQDSITGVCPPLPSQSPLINTGIERMLCSNFSFSTPPSSLFSLPVSLVSLFIIQSLVGVRERLFFFFKSFSH